MFNSTLQNLNNQINDSQSAIANLEAQLQQERENLKQLETHKQAFTTAASAAQSAKEQVMVAIQLLGTVAPENLSEFKDELNALFDLYSQSVLVETSTDTDSQDQSPNDEVPIEDVEVEVVTSTDSESTTEQPLSYKDLMQEDYDILKAIASDLGLPNGSKGKVSSGLAKAKITRSTIEAKYIINLGLAS